MVQALSKVPVYPLKTERDPDQGSAPRPAIVVACVSALVVNGLQCQKQNASAISSKFVFVVSPQVPDCSPEPISSKRRSFVYTLAMLLSYAARPCSISTQSGV